MKNDLDIRAVPILAVARANGILDGEQPLRLFSRLLEESQGVGADTAVAYGLKAWMEQDAAGQDEPWVRLHGQATLSMTCQRCLGLADIVVKFERDFRFVANEELAEVEDEESEEDVLVISRSFDMLSLIEDEILMAIPPVPKHEQCPQAVKFEAMDADFESPENAKPHPFAALQKLKGGEGG